ncbi:MAG: phospho-sugar mutase [Spirochaetales bacterium]|nr:phospho-sugar mutase [Spirochaetales bacterium]
MALTQLTKEEILERAKVWTKAPYSKECIDEISGLIAAGDDKELAERFSLDLDFGTGGMRGLIRFGTNGMNVYTVAKATQGLANYVLNQKGVEMPPKAAIAFDSRNFSRDFAKEAATVLATNGIKTYLFDDIRPTPELSFTVRELGCITGIVITASHNPKEYNGYKVYWNDGSQVITPHDKGIITEVKKIAAIEDVKQGSYDELIKDGMIEIIGSAIDKRFMEEVDKVLINKELPKTSDIKIVYTPLHGTGAKLIPAALKEIGYKNVYLVEPQMIPDGNFSTVASPNPEEPVALEMGTKILKEQKADILIATDPDADRTGIVIRDKAGNTQIVTGNQIGAILEYYILSARKAAGKMPPNPAVVKTVVTTNLQDEIAKSFGATPFNVLTGFKFIAQKIRNFEADKNYNYVFGCEESYGYLPGTYARDKDSIASALLLSECAAYLKSKGLVFADYLEEIFQRYGYYYDKTKSITIKGLAGMAKIAEIMKYFRDNPLSQVGGIDVAKRIDFQNDTVYDCKDNVYALPPSNVIQYQLADGSKVTMRPSGTEPKIKIYFSTKGKTMAEAQAIAEKCQDTILPVIDKLIGE